MRMMKSIRWIVVNIASVAAHLGGGLLGNSCYAAAKGAVIAFSKGIALLILIRLMSLARLR